jgi:ABC-2 type transport system ATP-binding protein
VLAELRHLQRATITVSLEGSPAALERLGGVHDITIDGARVTFSVDDGSMSDVLKTLAALGPRALVSAPPSLEELFLRHYGATANEKVNA